MDNQDDFIRERLSSNLEAYTNNAVLNKLTPGKTKGPTLRSATTTSGATSKRSTPSWNRKYPKRNDSNIVTSPVKTLKQFGNADSSDEYDTTTTYDINKIHKDSTTINVPLKSSPKKPLRKGTPKVPKTKQQSARESPNRKNPGSAKDAEVEDNRNDHHDSSSRRFVTNSHINYHISTQDEDDDYLGAHNNSNNTLLSEIPSDILSPEKHIYPQENLRRSSSNVPSATKTKDPLLSKSYPIFSPPKTKKLNSSDLKESSKTTTKSPVNRAIRHERVDDVAESAAASARGRSLPPSLYPTVELIGDQNEKEDPAYKKLSSDIVTSSRIVEDARETLSIRKKKESEAISIFFNRSNSFNSSHQQNLDHRNHSLESPRKKSTPPSDNKSKSPRTIPNLFRGDDIDYDKNSSFHQLNEFIMNPLIDHNKYKSTSETLIEKPSMSHRDSSLNHDETPNTTGTLNTQRRSSHLLDLSQFESSDEEPVPELTVPLNEELGQKPKSIKKRVLDEPIGTSTNKKPKPSLYPTIPSQTPVKRSENTTTATRQKPLYPTIPSVGHPARVSADMVENISDHIPNAELSKQKLQPQLPSQPKTDSRPEPVEQEREEPLGDPDHWVKNQWKTFFKAFKRFRRTNDLSIFSPRLLEYLRSDENEIKLKIQFALDYEDDLRKKN